MMDRSPGRAFMRVIRFGKSKGRLKFKEYTIPLAVVVLGFVGCEAEQNSKLFRGKVGDICHYCPESCHDETVSFTDECTCNKCTEVGYDPDANVLLSCTSHGWQYDRDCPGGVSVSCAGSLSYHIQCLDNDGGEVPF
jgi:hypothetical protein